MGRLVAGLAVVGLLMTAGCGDDDGGGASSEEIEGFCDGFDEINEQFAGRINPVDGSGGARGGARDVAGPGAPGRDRRRVHGPSSDGFEALSEIDITDPEAVGQVQEDLPEAEEAFNTVGQFVEEEC